MLYTPISLENNTFLLTECKGHTGDQAQQGLYRNDLGQIFPSMAGASEGSK